MSRITLTLLCVFSAFPQLAFAAEPELATADAMARYAALTGAGASNCRNADGGGDIIVCAKRRESDRQRLPFADARGDGDDETIIKGEIRTASAKRVAVGGCYVVSGQVCGGGVPILSISRGKFNFGTNGESTAPVALKILGYLLAPNQSGPELPKPRN